MASQKTIALDAMGGDHGPEVVIPGAALSLQRQPALSFMLFGDETRIAPILAHHARLKERSRIVHTSNVVGMDVKPSQALRRYRAQAGLPARLAVVGLVSNGFTIADPADAGMLDVAGFDAAAPSVIADFARG